ncbi:MAG: TonB-dependent receptor family protein [Bacteroidota bacterium]
MLYKKLWIPLLLITVHSKGIAQQKKGPDTLVSKTLNSVIVNTYLNAARPVMPDVQGTYLYAGKKTDIISMSITDADISLKSGRQVFAKVPGVFVYDMDGSGNQVNIATRGLDPHRGWELNNRKDGILTNSDMYGYPASHYSMPFESIDRIEFVRGTASLQYGAQYGGMLNYVSKKPDSTKVFSFESINTVGSYRMLSSYNAIGGTIGKISYYVYNYNKSREGYRKGEQTASQAQSLMLQYRPSAKVLLQAEWSRSAYLYKIPGQLTDAMFNADPQQATRNRNYFNPDIHIPSLQLEWRPSAGTEIKLITSAVLGTRNSVLFDKPANIRDTINLATGAYNNRQVDIDRFNSYTTELRIMQHYSTGKYMSTLVAGIQYMNNDLHRRQLGKGTTGSDFDLSLVDPVWGRDIHLKTGNIAFFAENKWQLSKRMELTTGVRVESGTTNMTGKINYYPDHAIPVQMKHRFPLLGMGWLYRVNERIQLYAGWSQSYRPMVFKDLIPSSVYEKVDPAIRDSKGYNAEAGFKGTRGGWKWDISFFLLKQKNRFGTLAQTEAGTGQLYTYRTNTGNSLTKGAEVFLQYDWQIANMRYSLFTSTAYMNARYTSGEAKNGASQNANIKGNKLEGAPDLTTRNGFTVRQKAVSITLLYSYTSSTYADALNTEQPPAATGAVGEVPSYSIVDLMSTCRIMKEVELRVSINNILNKQYFTKRPMFYPGPGIWPSDGRNINLTVAIKL